MTRQLFVAFAIVFFGALALPLFAQTHSHSTMNTTPAPSDSSLFHLEDEWTTITMTKMRLSDFADHPFVITMAYTTCKDICPLVVADMQMIERATIKDHGDDVYFIFVTLDPDHDTPTTMAAYAKDRGLDPDRWIFLQGDINSVRRLAAALGIRYRRVDATTIDHSTVITLVNKAGEIMTQSSGEPSTLSALTDTLIKITEK